MQKFIKKLNDEFLKTIDDYSEGSSCTSTNIPWALTEIEWRFLKFQKHNLYAQSYNSSSSSTEKLALIGRQQLWYMVLSSC